MSIIPNNEDLIFTVVSSINVEFENATDRRGNSIGSGTGWSKRRFKDILEGLISFMMKHKGAKIELRALDRSMNEFMRIVNILDKKGLASIKDVKFLIETIEKDIDDDTTESKLIRGYLSVMVDTTNVTRELFERRQVV